LFKAHREVTNRSIKHLGGKKIGTTLLVCLISDQHINVFNLGDTRLYHYAFDENAWKQVTIDHNLYNYLLEMHKKDNTIAINDLLIKYKSQLLSLTKCIESGSNVHTKFGSYTFKINSGDILFLASDGVYNFIKLDDVTAMIKTLSNHSFENISSSLIKLALSNNSNDNLTSVVIECLNKDV
jgi:protein phosphatase